MRTRRAGPRGGDSTGRRVDPHTDKIRASSGAYIDRCVAGTLPRPCRNIGFKGRDRVRERLGLGDAVIARRRGVLRDFNRRGHAVRSHSGGLGCTRASPSITELVGTVGRGLRETLVAGVRYCRATGIPGRAAPYPPRLNPRYVIASYRRSAVAADPEQQDITLAKTARLTGERIRAFPGQPGHLDAVH